MTKKTRDPVPDVTRRDFIEGVALGVGAALVPLGLAACDGNGGSSTRAAAQDLPGYYPPTLTGLRGSHPGSFEAAHALRDGKVPSAASELAEMYDLVVVGGGISGLSAALFYRDRVPGARVLVLDNHDDFGGHAKRNEFWIDGRLHLMNGGTYSIESPRPYSAIANGVLQRVGILRADDLGTAGAGTDYYASVGLGSGIFLDRETFGADFMLRHDEHTRWAQVLAGAPLSERARREIAELEEAPRDYLPEGLAPAAKKARLGTISYREFLLKIVGVDPIVAQFYKQRTHGLWGRGIEAVSALECWATGLPGCGGLETAGRRDRGDGRDCGRVCRHRWLRRRSSAGRRCDRRAGAGPRTGARGASRQHGRRSGDGEGALLAARPRRRADPHPLELNQTRAANVAGGVRIEYQRAGRGYALQARHAVLACWNAVIPYLCPELPEAQKAALHELVKTPLIYANVAVANALPWHRLGVASIHAPGGYFADIDLNECVALGGYARPTAAERLTVADGAHAVLAGIARTPAEQDWSRRDPGDQPRALRARNPRAAGPDARARRLRCAARCCGDHRQSLAARLCAGIQSAVPDTVAGSACANVIGRARRGAITIANSDAASKAYMDAAIEEAHRAVAELFTA